jgi:hypothetical protein
LFDAEYEVIKDQPGDSYYVRAMFDRVPETLDSSQLTFQVSASLNIFPVSLTLRQYDYHYSKVLQF